jgi:WD40 repeat protein
MSLKTIYPSFPPIARGNPSVIKTDAKRERIIYANSRTVIIKNVADPTKVQLFTGHQYPVTAVAMSPSGCYMATGDKSGKLMVWVRMLHGPRAATHASIQPEQPPLTSLAPPHRRATPPSKSSRATTRCWAA